MAQHEMPAASRVRQADPAAPTPPSPRSSRWAISRGALMVWLAVLLPAAASLLAAVYSTDIAYHLRAGEIMIESGALLDEDRFTFTALGDPWLNQQWAASVVFAAVYDVAGWIGLLLLRAGFVGLTFGLVYAACRGVGTSSVVASLVTLGAFVVAATNLALRSQLFAAVLFAAVMAILAWRRKHSWLLLLVPLLMLAWANTHGSFFIGWAALGLAFLEDLVARRRLAALTFVVGLISVGVTLLNPWGLEMWAYILELSSSPLLATIVTEWQAPTLRSFSGLVFFASVAVVMALLLMRGRVISWLQLLWLGGLILLSLMAVRSVIWWAIGAAPIVAILVDGLEVRGRRIGAPTFDEPRGIGYTAIAALLLLLALVAVPIYKPSEAPFGPEGVVSHAPPELTKALAAEAQPGDRLYAAQRWGSWFEFAVPEALVMVDARIELYDEDVWADYIDVTSGRADWAGILERWEVGLAAIGAENEDLLPFITADPDWELIHEDEDGTLFRRAE